MKEMVKKLAYCQVMDVTSTCLLFAQGEGMEEGERGREGGRE